jgi:hypothetical protein
MSARPDRGIELHSLVTMYICTYVHVYIRQEVNLELSKRVGIITDLL